MYLESTKKVKLIEENVIKELGSLEYTLSSVFK